MLIHGFFCPLLTPVRLEDAETFITSKCISCARAIFAQLLAVFPSDEAIWIRVAEFEKEHGTQYVAAPCIILGVIAIFVLSTLITLRRCLTPDRQSLEEHLQKSVKYCPQAEVLWLMGAKSMWLAV